MLDPDLLRQGALRRGQMGPGLPGQTGSASGRPLHGFEYRRVAGWNGAWPDGLLPAAAAQTVREIDFLTANFRPGAGYESFPSGSARRLPGGSNRYFQITMHYQPNGTAMQDRSRFGFWFGPTAPAAEIVKSPITGGLVTAEGKEVFNGAIAEGRPDAANEGLLPDHSGEHFAV